MRILNKQNFLNAVRLVKSFISNGNLANINIKFCDLEGNTIFHYAVSSGDYELLKKLLARFPNLGKESSSVVNSAMDNIGYNTRNDAGYTPLHMAAAENKEEILKALLETKISLNEKDEFSRTALHIAIERNHPKIIALLLENNNTDLNAATISGATPLHVAVMLNNYEIAELLIRKGASLNIKDTNNKTPIDYAAASNNLDLVELLIRNGAQIEDPSTVKYMINLLAHRDINELLKKYSALGQEILCLLESKENIDLIQKDTPLARTALEHAVVKRHHKAIQQLLNNHKVDTSKDIFFGYQLILIAIKNRDTETINLLLENGVDIFNDKRTIRSILYLSIIQNHTKLLNLLLNNINNIDRFIFNNFNPIHLAIHRYNFDIIELLLKKAPTLKKDIVIISEILHLILCPRDRVFIAKQDSYLTKLILDFARQKENVGLMQNGSPIATYIFYLALKIGDIEVIQTLLDNKKVNINNKIYLRLPFLDLTGIYSIRDETKSLFTKKEIINIEDEENSTPLHIAARSGHRDIVRALIKANADINYRNIYGQTALMIASYNGHTDIVKDLIKAEANLSLEDKNGITALMWAITKNKLDAVKALINKADTPNRPDFTRSILEQDLEREKFRNAINYQNRYLTTPLMWAILKDKSVIASLLIESNANPHPRDAHGRSALMLAVEKNNTAIVQLLLQKAVDLNCRDNYGRTALSIAQKIGNPEMLRILHDAIRNQQTEVSSHVNKEQTRRTNLQPMQSRRLYKA